MQFSSLIGRLRREFVGSLAVGFAVVACMQSEVARAAEGMTDLPANRPVQVQLNVELLEVSQIQDHDQKFEIEFYLYLVWFDPRLAFDPNSEGGRQKKVLPADQIWTPDPQLMDELDVSVQDGHEAHVHANGQVVYRQYYRGTMSSNFDLHNFPRDEHALEVHIEAAAYDTEEVLYVPGEINVPKNAHVVPAGWKLFGTSSSVHVVSHPQIDESNSRFVFRVHVSRDPHYYLWAILVPLVPIVVTSWSVFWMEAKEFSSQVGVGVTAMLTMVAYRITIDSSLPPLSYMTRMDFVLLVCQVFVFESFILSVIIQVCHGSKRVEIQTLGACINHRCRWQPPLVMTVACALLVVLPTRYLTPLVVITCAITLLILYPRRKEKQIAEAPEPSLAGVAVSRRNYQEV